MILLPEDLIIIRQFALYQNVAVFMGCEAQSGFQRIAEKKWFLIVYIGRMRECM